MAKFEMAKWALVDDTGVVRTDIEEHEMFHLLHINAKEGNRVHAINEEGTQKVQLVVEDIEPVE